MISRIEINGDYRVYLGDLSKRASFFMSSLDIDVDIFIKLEPINPIVSVNINKISVNNLLFGSIELDKFFVDLFQQELKTNIENKLLRDPKLSELEDSIFELKDYVKVICSKSEDLRCLINGISKKTYKLDNGFVEHFHRWDTTKEEFDGVEHLFLQEPCVYGSVFGVFREKEDECWRVPEIVASNIKVLRKFIKDK